MLRLTFSSTGDNDDKKHSEEFLFGNGILKLGKISLA